MQKQKQIQITKQQNQVPKYLVVLEIAVILVVGELLGGVPAEATLGGEKSAMRNG